jgi:hypothetical protein
MVLLRIAALLLVSYAPVALDSSGLPVGKGGLLVPELRRFIVQVFDGDDDGSGEVWWCYDLESGAPLMRASPTAGPAAQMQVSLDARAVPGTPLVLVHGYDGTDSVFQLVDAELALVWTLRRPDDPGWSEGATAATRDHGFDLRSATEPGLVSYRIERAGEAWHVDEIVRGDAPEPRAR